jgi:endonuclease/exonuclease/phosphatase family metal-dependent hydrolase
MTAEPQLVVGDFNALPTDATHADMLMAGFIDVGGAVRAVGATCCQAPDLDNAVSQLSGRIDYVFDRGFSSIDSASVGNTPFENVRPRWPSGHAGVIATVDCRNHRRERFLPRRCSCSVP